MQTDSELQQQWYVLRDLKRPNAKNPAWRRLSEAGFEVFTPMKTVLSLRGGRKVKEQVPVVSDLLFVHSTRSELDPEIELTETLQYRFMRGAPFGTPMTVGSEEMERFIAAVSTKKNPAYYLPSEIQPAMYGRKVRMICAGPLNGYVGTLLKVKGSGKKRLIVELESLLTAVVEIESTDYVELI